VRVLGRALSEDMAATLAGVAPSIFLKTDGVKRNGRRASALRARRIPPIRVRGRDAGHSSSFLGRRRLYH